MSKIRSVLEQAKQRPPYTPEPLALHAMRTGCSGAPSSSTASVPVPTSRHRLFHKMDRSCASLRSLDTKWSSSCGRILFVGSASRTISSPNLALTEFAYNSSANRITCLSSFENRIGFKPRQTIDLVLMAHHILRYQTLHLHSHLIYVHYMRKSETR